MTPEIRGWLLGRSEGDVCRAWRFVRDDLIREWLEQNADDIVAKRLMVHEALERCQRAAFPACAGGLCVCRAAFMRAKRLVFPNGWRGPRGRKPMTAEERDVEGQELIWTEDAT